MPERATRAFERHDAFEPRGDGYGVTTTHFESRVVAAETDDRAVEYTVTVRAPMLRNAVADDAVGPAVEKGWFDTYRLRLEDATMATRADVDLDEYDVTEERGEAVARFVFRYGNADHAPDVVKAVAEFVEGTYVEGVVPGYEYRGTVAELLGEARQSGGDDGTNSPMPL